MWPTEYDIISFQKAHKRPLNLKQKDEVSYTDKNQIWIPDESDHLQLQLCFIAHSGAAGHRGIEAMLK